MDKLQWLRCADGSFVKYDKLETLKIKPAPISSDYGQPVSDDDIYYVVSRFPDCIQNNDTQEVMLYKDIILYKGTIDECDAYILNLINGNIGVNGRVKHGFSKDDTAKLIEEMNADVS